MKMRVRNILTVCGVGMLLLMSCKKEKIEIPESNDPVFRVDGSIGGEAFSLVAGDDNAYMNTMTESVNGVSLFSGKLSNGSFSIELGIFDGQIDKSTSQALTGITNLNAVFASVHEEPLMTLSKNALPNSQNIQQINWFVDGVPKGINIAQIYEPGKYNVCGEIKFWDGTIELLCNELIVGYSINANYAIDFSVDTAGNLTTELEALTSPIDHVEWYVDENQIGSGTGSTFQSIVSSTLHKLKAIVYFENGVVKTKQALVDATGSLHSVHDFTNFELESMQVIPQDFNIRIHVEKNGKLYMSEESNNYNSTLNVTGIEYYGKNSNNKDVYKISGEVNAKIQELNSTKAIDLNFTAVFGIEIP